jgi:2-amino-4-hydroxy-6-hydroxymethyldihydropteridine diphosphokinase
MFDSKHERLPSRTVVVGLGTNLGDRFSHLEAALEGLRRANGTRVVAVSRVYETEALGPPQPRYLNAAVRLETTLSLLSLLGVARAIEGQRGRVRHEKWGPRTLDIDILWSEGETHSTEDLEVPHPRLFERAFALAPLLEVLPSAPPEFTERLAALGGSPAHLAERLSSPK